MKDLVRLFRVLFKGLKLNPKGFASEDSLELEARRDDGSSNDDPNMLREEVILHFPILLLFLSS